MADEEAVRPIIIKKRKVQGGGHHGGAWKVAYADFVTAMMAFFMVMWLVASVNKEQRAALFEYFNNPSMEEGKSTKAAPGQQGPGGASTSAINLGGGLDAPRSSDGKENGLGEPTNAEEAKKLEEEEAKRIAEAAEHKKLESLAAELSDAVSKSQALAPFKDQLLIDITPEGLRLQIIDKQNRTMFDVGRAELKDYTIKILRELAPFLARVPNSISISGHTDAKPYGSGAGGYSNWELSADRANAARRELIRGGLTETKFQRVVGLASSVLFEKTDPLSAKNRRISIIVMTKTASEAARATDEPARTEEEAVAPGTTSADAPKPAAPVADATPAATANPAPAANPPAAAKPAPAASAAPALSPAAAALAAARAAAPRPAVATKPAATPATKPASAPVTPP
ncbi:MAG: flagellar motor protein MotB [Proteobacteria bacterium]|nr:flagellar motor protein MotB [Pseudomonadota bacterium]